MIRVKRTALVALLAIALLSLLWFTGGKTWADQLLSRFLTEPKEEFTIPAVKMPLTAAVTQDREEVTICNRGVTPWEQTLVRVNDGYVSKMKGLGVGDCTRIRKTSFLSTDWKHLPAARDLQVTEVEILSHVSGVGYTREQIAPVTPQ